MAMKTATVVEVRTCVAHAFAFHRGEWKACSMPSWSFSAALQLRTGSSALIAAMHTINMSTRKSSLSARHVVATRPTDSRQPQHSEVVRRPKILVAEKLDEAGLERLKSVADVECSYNLSQEELCAKISVYDALIVMSGTRVTREVFKASKGTLKVVGSAGLVGLDNVDLQAAAEVGCLVVNASTVNTRAAAEQMKKGVRIANMATPGVIDKEALLRALDMGLVGQEALDVFKVEPPEKDSMLIQHEKVLVTRPLGFSTAKAEGVAVEIAEAVIGALWGELTATALWTRVYSELDLLQG